METVKLKEMLDNADITQYKLAKLLDIAPTTVNQWFARNSIKESHIIDVCNVTGFDIKELLPYFEEKEKNKDSSYILPKEKKNNDVVYIQRVKNVTASAGDGEYMEGIDVFEKDKPIPFLRSDLPQDRDPNKMEAIKVKGTSMLPTFMPNDWVTFDKGTNYYDGDGLYVLNYAGNLLIKRLQFNMASNSMEIISDNPQYTNYSINLTENQENLNIIGSVLFKVQREL